MDIYIDKENALSLIGQKDKPEYPDCMRALQRQLNCKFNFPKNDLSKNEILLAWFKKFTQGVGKSKKEFLEPPFPPRKLKSNCYIHFNQEQLSSAYLLDDEKLQNLKDKGVIMIGRVGEELEVISSVFLHNDDYKFDRKLRIGGVELKNWQDLIPFQFETSDILICDPFIISDPQSFKDNLIPLLSILATKSFAKINVVIYTKYDDNHMTYDQVKSEIKEAISKSTKVKAYFTLVRYRDQRNMNAPQAEHDRTIFTSYCRYYSGDSFNYWNADGSKKTKGRELHLASYGDRENHNLAKELISDIQKNINSLSAEFIAGDKKSNFLNFT